MSFILEALKKSENERQRKVGPSLADVQVRSQRSEKPWWAFAVAGLLLVNLTVLLVVLLRDDKSTPRPEASQSAASQQPLPAAGAPRTTGVTPSAANRPSEPLQQRSAGMSSVTADPSVRSLADEATVDNGAQEYSSENPDLAVAAAVPDGPSIVQPIQAPAVAPTTVRPQPQRQAPSEPAEVLPTFRELGGANGNLPELHLDIHVHSPVPAERFVFVNMRKYIEGQSLSEGPLVERITADGVILNHRGLRFLLPRQ